MLKKLFLALAGVTALALVPAFAEDAKVAKKEDKKEEKKELKLEGDLVCVKCVLKEKGVTACANALVVKGEDKKEVVYYLDDKGGKEEYHSACCQEADETPAGGKEDDEFERSQRPRFEWKSSPPRCQWEKETYPRAPGGG